MKRFFSSRFKFNPDVVSVGLLLVITAGLFWRSYVQGTFLMGWDSVMSEFNLGLAFQRSFTGIWQAFQGVGLQGGHGYVTDLVRLPWLWLLTLLLPLSLVRYMMVYLMWLLGIVGAFVLIRRLVKQPMIGLVGALIYGLHPFTIQNFFVIHDAFGWLFMSLPWSVWLLLSILDKPTKKKWLLWIGLQFAASFIGFIPPAFVGYGLFLAAVGLASKKWKRGLVALVLMGVANAYWLLPFGYYTMTGSNTYVVSKLNQITTEHNALISQSYGGLTNLLLGKGFYFESLDWMQTETRPILGFWIEWWNRAEVKAGLLVLALTALFGLVLGKYKYKKSLVAAFGIVLIILMLPSLFQYMPLLGQAFRIPFTKLGFEYVLLFSLFGSLGLDFLYRKFLRLRKVMLVVGAIIVALIAWPLVNGKFFYDKMRVTVPDEYFQVMDYLKQKDVSSRIAVLPAQSYNGWYIQNWNYTGSGFLFYGVSQPLFDRAFDVWSPYNETFYNELSTAFYLCPVAPDETQLVWCANNVKQVFDKYQVSLALLDESVILPGQSEEIIRYDLWKRILTTLDPQVDFVSGVLSVYAVGENTTSISVPKQYQQINADTTYGRFDPFYLTETAYVDGGEITYLFAGITRENISKQVSYPQDELVTIDGELSTNGGTVIFPTLTAGDVISGRIRVSLSETSVLVELLPFGELVVGEERFPLWLDRKIEVLLPNPVEQVWVMVNGERVEVSLDEQRELWGIEMEVGMPLTVDVFDADGEPIGVEGLREATATKCSVTKWCMPVNLGEFKLGELISVVTDQDYCVGREGETYSCQQKTEGTIVDEQGNYWLDVVLNQQDEELDLPVVSAHQRIASYVFDASMWGEMKNRYDLEGTGEARWEMPATAYEVGSMKYEASEQNCDVLERGSADKSQVETGILYQANNYGAYCDSWFVEPITSEGIVRLTGENITGRGIKFSVFSGKEDRTILEQLLPNGGAFDQSFGFLTGLDFGSTINLETKSFGFIDGVNRLDSIQFYPVPLTFLQKIQITGSEGEVAANPLVVSQVNKWGTGVYKVKIQSSNYKLQMDDEGQSGLVVLNQGYDKGWVAFKGTKQLEHSKVNGWANGWMLDGSNDEEQMTTVVIIYWPQLLEWVGLGLLLTCGLYGAYTVKKLFLHKK